MLTIPVGILDDPKVGDKVTVTITEVSEDGITAEVEKPDPEPKQEDDPKDKGRSPALGAVLAKIK